MSRNDINHFAVNPSVNIQRSRFNLDSTVKFTGNTGDLIPFYCLEVLPGDTFEVTTSMVCRLQTLIHPIMDNMFLDTYYFFVPNRLVWDHWKNFCGEPDKAWLPSVQYTVPQLEFDLTEYESTTAFATAYKDTIADYLGIPVPAAVDWKFSVNALPFRAVSKIYDDWFRDENLIDPVNLYTGDNTVKFNPNSSVAGGKCYKAAKVHDYFTSCLPQAQRGNPVTLATGGIDPRGVEPYATNFFDTITEPMKGILRISGTPDAPCKLGIVGNSGSDAGYRVLNYGQDFTPTNLGVNLSGMSLGITINDLRLAFQVQKFMEKSARGGARYIEILKEMFGVTSPDARLQRSEYLGGHRIPITIHQIVNQTETIDSPLGNTGAMSLTSDVHNDFVHSFVEHGFIIGICVCRYKHSYSQGFYPMFSRQTKFDYYWPVFANIGEQPVKQSSIYLGESFFDLNGVFGYQEAWADYRNMFDRVAGEMRPGVPNTLASWHLGDYYTETPYLSEEWIEEDKTNVDRALAVTSAVSDQLLFDFYVKNKATRPMPMYSIPGFADHH